MSNDKNYKKYLSNVQNTLNTKVTASIQTLHKFYIYKISNSGSIEITYQYFIMLGTELYQYIISFQMITTYQILNLLLWPGYFVTLQSSTTINTIMVYSTI